MELNNPDIVLSNDSENDSFEIVIPEPKPRVRSNFFSVKSCVPKVKVEKSPSLELGDELSKSLVVKNSTPIEQTSPSEERCNKLSKSLVMKKRAKVVQRAKSCPNISK